MYLNILSPPYPLNHGNVMCTAIVLPGRADGGMDAQTHPSLLSLSFLLSAWILYHKHGKSAKPAGLRSPCILWFFCSFICYLLSLGTLLWMPPAVSGLSLMWISVWALSFCCYLFCSFFFVDNLPGSFLAVDSFFWSVLAVDICFWSALVVDICFCSFLAVDICF